MTGPIDPNWNGTTPVFPQQRVALPTGVELDMVTAGDPAAPAIVLLHGFPESHRTWRHQIPELARDHFVIAPDQRGYARSSKPPRVEDYAVDKPVADLFALADHFGLERFTLIGHDWGGAVAWLAALGQPARVERLIIVNAPHPMHFQRTLHDDPEQRKASQYINAVRETQLDKGWTGAALERLFSTTFAQHVVGAIAGDEKAVYLDQWGQPGAMTAMLNWYRASGVAVPRPGEDVARPAQLDAPFPKVGQPVLVIWGMRDKALLPVQLHGLEAFAEDLTVVPVEEGGHFVPWECPEEVNHAIQAWLAGQ